MKRAITTLVVVLCTIATAASAQQASERPDLQDRPESASQFLLSPATLVAAKSASRDIVYCLTSNLWEVWSNEEWDPFSQTLSVCDDHARTAETEGQTHYLDEWELNYKWLYAYDEAGNQIEWLMQDENDDGTAYENDRRLTQEYDEEGARTSFLWQDWDGAMWVNDERQIQAEDGEVGPHTLNQEWDGAMWVNVEREWVDLEDFIATTETWDGTAWVPTERYEVSFMGNDWVQTNQIWDGSAWVNESRFTFSDTEGFRRVEIWDGVEWMGEQNQILTYDEHGNLVELLEQFWDGDASGWVNDYRAVYVFDETGSFQTEFHLDEWNADDGIWEDDLRQLSTLDANGNEIEELWQDWNDVAMEWEDLQRYTRTYQAIDVAIERPNEHSGFSLSQNYPNPAVTTSRIRFEMPAAGDVAVALFDVLGRRVRTLYSGPAAPGATDLDVSVADLAAGMYYYRMEYGEVVLTRQMIVVR